MTPLSSYQQRYRLHQAYSKYPKLSLLADVTKTVCLCGFVATVAWVGYTAATYENNPYQTMAVNVVNADKPVNADPGTPQSAAGKVVSAQVRNAAQTPSGDVEIPAVANTTAAATEKNSNLPLLAAEERKIYESDWIFLLADDKFVIQFGSSSNRALVYEEANTFPTGPIAVYPFKKTQSNKLVYGYSSGVYNSLEDAQRALYAMPKKIQKKDPWIRPVGRLQKKIMQLSDS